MTALSRNRVSSIDLLKGVVTVLMALDHTRDYFHQSSVLLDMTNPAHATYSVYLTRWITHLCAPAFSFLAGISAYLSGKKKTKAALSVFLIKRGLWLIFMELTIISFAWYLDITFNNLDLAVIWVLGVSMIFLAGFIHLPQNMILFVSCIIIFGHNLLDQVHFSESFLWGVIHEVYSVKLSKTRTLTILYPIIPWIAVMALGYYFGHFFDVSVKRSQRQKLFNGIGFASIILFVLIRLSNIYGDPVPWVALQSTGRTFMSFMNLNKYPPSFLYLLATLSFTFLFLANSEKWHGKLVDFFSVFGGVPFFYYLAHLYTIRLLSLIAAELTGHGWQLMIQRQFDVDLKDFGFSLPVVYLIWIGIILLLFPICKRFDHYKQNHKDKGWLSYL
jgi:uncharacterized membrane protein